MKQGKPVITFVVLALAAVVAIYFASYVFQALDEPYKTVQAYSYTFYDSVSMEGLLVRQAQVLPAQSGILEVTRAEGEKVGRGQEVALVYRDSQAQASQAQIEQLEMEIELLEYAIAQGGDPGSAARLDEDILQAVVDLRSSYALGDCTQLRDQVMAVKSGVLKRGYTYNEGLTSADLSARLKELNGELATLSRQSARATTRITAPASGVFSSMVDGYEPVLTPDSVLQLTPSSLQALLDNPAGEDGSAIGKLITDNTWYFAANLPQASAERLKEGGTATLRFSGELNREVDMTVVKLGPTQEGKTLAVFSTNRYLSLTSALRRQTVELIFDSYSGLRVPKQALRLEEVAQEEEQTGGQSAVNQMVVYVLVNGRAESREVSIVYEGSDYYVVRPEGTGRRLLRSGDAVITQATGLRDGLMLEAG